MPGVKMTVRMGTEDHARLKAQADGAGVSMEAYIRGLIRGLPYQPRVAAPVAVNLASRPVVRHPIIRRPTLAAKAIRDEQGKRL